MSPPEWKRLFVYGIALSLALTVCCRRKNIKHGSQKGRSPINILFIEHFKSSTATAVMVPDFLRILKNEFLFDGRLELAQRKNMADYLLQGVILKFADSQFIVGDRTGFGSGSVHLSVGIKFLKRHGKKASMYRDRFEDFISLSDTTLYHEKEKAKDELYRSISRKIVQKVVEKWQENQK